MYQCSCKIKFCLLIVLWLSCGIRYPAANVREYLTNVRIVREFGNIRELFANDSLVSHIRELLFAICGCDLGNIRDIQM